MALRWNERRAIEARLRRNFEILGIRVKEQCVVSLEDVCTKGLEYFRICISKVEVTVIHGI